MNHLKEATATNWTPAVSRRARGKVVGAEEDASDGEEGVPGELAGNGPTRINYLLNMRT